MQKLIMNQSLELCSFVVNDDPYCVVDFDLRDRNLEVLEGFQHGYFDYLADTHGKYLETEHKKLAATSLRSAYVQGLETFFALLFASLQAPACIGGWLSKYTLPNLRALTESTRQRKKFLTRIPLKETSWEGIVEAIHGFHRHDVIPEEIAIWKRVATVWSRFAQDFLNEDLQQEYNSIKHGLRTQPGGIHLAFAPDNGIPPKDTDYKSLGGSDYGSAFLKPEGIGHKHHFRIRRFRINWHPDNLIAGLHLISQSISNVVAFLKTLNGIKETAIYWPPPEEFEAINKHHVALLSVNFDKKIESDFIEKPFTAAEIRESYQKLPEAKQKQDQETGLEQK